ncbi:hypothetical protein H2203_004280 [Taxawa tesnikishii (nom. ined.)]|nr:hypothetical protein H2203_004280 [Dothideales sp. JES 119]
MPCSRESPSRLPQRPMNNLPPELRDKVYTCLLEEAPLLKFLDYHYNPSVSKLKQYLASNYGLAYAMLFVNPELGNEFAEAKTWLLNALGGAIQNTKEQRRTFENVFPKLSMQRHTENQPGDYCIFLEGFLRDLERSGIQISSFSIVLLQRFFLPQNNTPLQLHTLHLDMEYSYLLPLVVSLAHKDFSCKLRKLTIKYPMLMIDEDLDEEFRMLASMEDLTRVLAKYEDSLEVSSIDI